MCAPHRDGHGDHPHEREAEHRIEDELPAEIGEGRAEQDGTEQDEGDAVQHRTDLFGQPVEPLGVASQRKAEHHAGRERGDEPRPAERVRDAICKTGAGRGDHLPPLVLDQAAPARLPDDHRDQDARDGAPQDAVTDLLDQQRGRAPATADVRFHVGERNRGEQERDADAVVQPALDIQPLPDPRRHARLDHDRLPERRVGRSQDDRENHRLLDGQLPEHRRCGDRSQQDRQRQAYAEQPHRHADRPAKLAEIDPRCVGEEHEGEGGLGQHPDRRPRAGQVDPVQRSWPHQQPESHEQHRRGDGRAHEPLRDRGNAEQSECHQG